MNKISRELKNNIQSVSFEEIEKTDFYKKMPKFHKNFFQQNKKHITHQVHHGFNVSKNLGFEGWERQTSSNYQVKGIVSELLEGRG